MKKSLLLSIALFLFGISSYAQWTVQRPPLGVNNFNSVFFVNANTGYVAGDNGSIHKTNDAGATWTNLSPGWGLSLTSIFFTDVNTGYAVDTLGTIIKTVNGGANWTILNSGTSEPLYAVYFTGSYTGFAAGENGTILKTINAGETWFPLYSLSASSIFSICFTDANNGYFVGGNGRILKTTDGGATWTYPATGTFMWLKSVSFPNSGTGYAVGYDGTIIKTIDAGESWSMLTSGTTRFLRSVYFTDVNTGYIVGRDATNGGLILKTTDAGMTWTTQYSGNAFPLLSCYFISPILGYAVGMFGDVLKTTDGGAHWNNLAGLHNWDVNEQVESVYFTDANIGYAVGYVTIWLISGGYKMSSYILKTTNGGATWTTLYMFPDYHLRSVFFTDGNTGYAVGSYNGDPYDGMILKTDNAFNTFTNLSYGSANGLLSVYFTDANTGYICDAYGNIRKTINGGTSWTILMSGTTNPLYSVCFTNASSGYVVGSNGTILKTSDAGNTWTSQSSGTTNGITSVFFTDDSTGYAVGGTILKTTDAGNTWISQSNGNNEHLYSVYFADVNTGYAVGNSDGHNGRIKKTTDGGTTWTSLESGISSDFRSVFSTGINTVYIGGSRGIIMKTTTAGEIVPPIISTTVPSSVLATMAVAGGNITSDGAAPVTARGVCVDVSPYPDLTVYHTSDGTGSGSFLSYITGLLPATTYHIRAYATNSKGTSYGNDITFTTSCPPGFTLPYSQGFNTTDQPACWTQYDHQGNGQIWQFGTLSGNDPPALGYSYAFLNSEGYGNGNSQNADLISPVLDLSNYSTVRLSFSHYYKGFQGSSGTLSYSINNGASYTTIQNFTATTVNPVTFSQFIPGVAGESQVKFRWNYAGSWGYFWAIDDVTVSGANLSTAVPTSLTTISAVSGGNITNDGASPITARGVCWSLTSNPTISGNHTTDGSGSGSFISNITGLQDNTNYHVRSYATNGYGTWYGNDIVFTTPQPSAPIVTTTYPTTITTTTAVTGGNITNDGGRPVTARGVCWSLNAFPTLSDNYTSDGSGSGVFVSNISNLTPGTNYHIRAFAINSIGNSYGNDINFSAACPNYSLPFNEAFPTTSQPICWSQNDLWGEGDLWQFGTITGYGANNPALAGNYAFLNSAAYGSGSTQDVDLVTPVLDFSGYSTVTLGFKHFFRNNSSSSGKLAYSFDNGANWNIIQTFSATTANPAAFSQALPAVAGHSQVWFKWNFTGSNALYWAIDDIQISGVANVIFLSTTAPSSITNGTAISGGIITDDGGSAITARGVCWGTSVNPVISGNHTNDGSGIGIFTSNITGLSAGTSYHVRAYATNSTGTYYGNDISFSTPCVIASLPFNEGFTSTFLPNCWSQVDNWGEGQVWQFGVITGYGANNPVLTGNYAFLNSDAYGQDYTQDADLISPMMDLTGYVTVNLSFKHFYRSLSTSAATLSYSMNNGASWNIIQTFTANTANPETFSQSIPALAGQSQVKFKWNYSGSFAWYWAIDDIQVTGISAAILSTSTPSAITTTTAISGGNITSDGGAPVTARGVCWSIWPNPEVTATGSHTTDGSGTGSFISNMTGLDALTAYHVRAYATTSAGTWYGNDILFTTPLYNPPDIATSVPSSITTTTAVSGGNIIYTGGPPITARGVCWSMWPEPDIIGSHTNDGSGVGSFISSITGLDANTNYHVRAYATTSNGTYYGNDILFTTVLTSQQLSIPNGWSGVSSHIIPANPAVEAIYNPILGNLAITYNMTGIYYPVIPINTIGNWDNNSGYVIKMNNASGLSIWGSEVSNKIVNLNQGWNLIPALSSSPYNIVTLFTGVPGFAVAKDVAGSGVYWKAYGINTIEFIQPGKAYYVRMNSAGSIDYSLPSDNSTSGKPTEITTLSTPWNAVVNTPASHLVAFVIGNGPFQNGDIVGGFTKEGWCAGVAGITDPSAPFALNLNGDDEYSPEKDGFENGEILKYQLYRPSTKETFDLEVTYNPEMNTGHFENNGVAEVTFVKMSATGISNPGDEELKVYPNPAKEILIIESASMIKEVEMMNFTGQTVYANTAIESRMLQIDVSQLASGVYFVKIKTGRGIHTRKVSVTD